MESQIRVVMFDDRIEIVSPGGLPSGITEKEYLSGKLSVLRNRDLANVFYRLGFVEIFGTGIIRIKQLYELALVKPDFEVSENAIRIVLPVFEMDLASGIFFWDSFIKWKRYGKLLSNEWYLHRKMGYMNENCSSRNRLCGIINSDVIIAASRGNGS